MRVTVASLTRRASVAVLAAVATACISDRDPPAPPPPPPADCDVAPAIPVGQPFTISGTATYDFVPARYNPASGAGGLDFAATQQRPVRGADVQIRQCTTVLAAATTDATGHYSATFTPGAGGNVYVTVLARTASPPIQVQDNADGNAVWAVAQPIVSTSPTLDVRATHGWTGFGYGPSRIAAPFAILDSMYTAARRLLDLPRDIPFPPLRVNWSPSNFPCLPDLPSSCVYDPPSGRIISSHYDPSSGEISVLGADGVDTDEFDNEVIVHEWAHYFEDNLSRSDSPGGRHGFGDVLDPRLSFGEGYASAFAAMLLEQPIYADTYWGGSGLDAFGWDVETRPTPTDDPEPGPFSELSVIRAVWDLYDAGTGEPSSTDPAALGLEPIYDTLIGPERTTPALTTIASFIAGLKTQPGVVATQVDAVLSRFSIGPVATEWGDGDADLRAMFEDVAVPSSAAATLDGRFDWNQQPQNRYYVFTATGTQATVTSTASYDVDLEAYHHGALLAFALSTSGNETITFPTAPGQVYVVVLTGWGGLPSDQPGVTTYGATVSFANP